MDRIEPSLIADQRELDGFGCPVRRTMEPTDKLFDRFAPIQFEMSQTKVTYATYPVSSSGHYAPAFYNDWYFRIHLYPTKTDVGNLVSRQSREILLWNAYTVNPASFERSRLPEPKASPSRRWSPCPPATLATLGEVHL